LFDEVLGSDIQFELDIMLGGRVGAFVGVKLLAHELSDGLSSLDRAELGVSEIHEKLEGGIKI